MDSGAATSDRAAPVRACTCRHADARLGAPAAEQRYAAGRASGEAVEPGDNADVGLTLRYHLELGWIGVDVVGFLACLLGHVRDWVVTPLAREIRQ